MSWLYYFASDSVLKEQSNPFVKCLSVNQALEMGIEVDLQILKDIDKDEPNVILFCEDEMQLEYPEIFSIDRKDYSGAVETTRQYCVELQWSYSNDTVSAILKYMQEHMKLANEIELWRVWIGSGDIITRKKTQCYIRDLTVDRLTEFFVSELDVHCLTVTKTKEKNNEY